MEFETYSHRHAEDIIHQRKHYLDVYNELVAVIESITDYDLANDFYSRGDGRGKSLSKSINAILKKRLVEKKWDSESKIFKPKEFKNPWKLDFTKYPFSMEVAFNHGEATAWNLMKPVIASEINHVEKEFQTEIGIIILANQNLKSKGGFDGTVKTFESIEQFLLPLRTYLTIPILIIGLEAPRSFTVDTEIRKNKKGSKLGMIRQNNKIIEVDEFKNNPVLF
mgnify:CR=1 FL=1